MCRSALWSISRTGAEKGRIRSRFENQVNIAGHTSGAPDGQSSRIEQGGGRFAGGYFKRRDVSPGAVTVARRHAPATLRSALGCGGRSAPGCSPGLFRRATGVSGFMDDVYGTYRISVVPLCGRTCRPGAARVGGAASIFASRSLVGSLIKLTDRLWMFLLARVHFTCPVIMM